MKNPTPTQFTRASLAATASHNARWFASLLAGTTVLGSSALHAATWDGETDNNWNTITNWDGNIGTGGTNATVNIVGNAGSAPFRAIISENLAATPVDIFVGTGIGVSARLDHTAGFASTGGNNWMFVGRDGGTGVYNLADTAVPVATGPNGPYTGFGQGTGSLDVGAGGPGGRLYIGGNTGTGSTGTVNINTDGIVNVRNQMQIGTATSVGTLNIDNGTINAGSAGGDDDWFEIGNGGGCTGTINIHGGTLTKTAAGNQHFIVGANGAQGFLKQTGGTINVNSEFWVANNAGSNGLYTLSAGTINVSSWVAIGRGSSTATGVVNMTGGTWNKTGATQFIVGANGSGTMNMSGGLVDVQGGGYTWVGEAANATTGVLTISGTAEFRSPTFGVGQSSPAAVLPALGAILNLDGGTVRTLRFNGARNQDDTGASGGIGTVNFNGTQIIASGDNTTNFISTTLDNAFIGNTGGTGGTGGLRVDTNGFNLTAPKVLPGPGGVIKSGAGTLTLSGANTYNGDTSVNAGTLNLNTSSSGAGNITVADTAALGMTQVVDNQTRSVPNLTFGSAGATTLNVDYGNFAFNPTTAPLTVTGAFTVNGPLTINYTDALPVVGSVPVIAHANPTAGSGSFVAGTVPNGVVLDPVTPITDTLGVVSLNVDRVNAPYWNGNQDAIWTTANNWIDDFSELPTTYADPDPALFDDRSTGFLDVVLNSTVSPGGTGTTFDSTFTYTLSGSGKISGTKGLTKLNSGSLTISTENDFTGPTILQGGITSVAKLFSSDTDTTAPLGTGSLILAGGTLDYTGGIDTIDRGFTIAAANNGITSTLLLANNVTMSGQVTATLGKLRTAGPGVLTLTFPGANVLGNGTDPALTIDGGGLTLNGTGQVNTVTGGTLVANDAGSNSTLTVSGDTVLNLNRFQIALAAGSVGNVIIEDSGSINKTGGSWCSIGNGSDGQGTMTVRDSGSFSAGGGDLNISDVGTSKGTLNIEENGTVSATGVVFVGKNTGTEGTVTMSGNATFNTNTYITIGRANGSIGTFNMNDGVINQTDVNAGLIVGEEGNGTFHMNGGEVNVGGGGFYITAQTSGTGNGTINLNGGIITAKRVTERDNTAGTSTFNFNGGLLRAGAGANPAFMLNLNNAFVKTAGAFIDSNSQNIAIDQPLLEDLVNTGGGLTKSGDGTLLLNGANTYTGTTTVTAGTLGGTGSVAGAVVVNNTAALAPGASTGTFTAASATFDAGSSFVVEVDDGQTPDNDLLAVSGNLHITAGATMVVNLTGAVPTLPITVATFASRSGVEFPNPPGVTLVHNATNIQITAITPQGYNQWIGGFSVGGLTAKTDDPDMDGMTNLEEFGLDGDPSTGAATGKIRSRIETVGAEEALVITFPVRMGATFDNVPGPGADATVAADDLLYTIEGSNTLAAFDQGVTEVSPASAAGMPALSDDTKWEYRTFRLDGAVPARGPKGFLSVTVEDAP